MKNAFSTLIVLLLLSTQTATSQDTEPGRTLSIEVNPLAYAFTGWSIGGTYRPASLNRWVFNAGAYGFQLPDVFVEQIPGNEDKGFALEISPAATIGVDYYPWNRNRSGLAFGLSTVLAGFEVTNESEPGEANYTSIYLVPRASYAWFVLDKLYVMPWVGIEIHNKIRGDTQVGTLDFEPMTIQFSPNISIGYYFK
jgi:hypothetical protein